MRKTSLINCYNNKIGLNTTYQGDIDSNRRAIEDIDWNLLIQDRKILLDDFNAHSPIWNPLISTRIETRSLEEIIEKFDLILNNEPGIITRTNARKNQSIIDLTFTSTAIELLNSWIIEEKYFTSSDHELIVFEWLYLELNQLKSRSQEITGWNIQKLEKDEKQLNQAYSYWQEISKNQPLIDEFSMEEDLEDEANWIEKSLTKTLDLFVKPIRITAFSKRWWNSTVKETRSTYSQMRRKYKLNLEKLSSRILRNKFKKTRNEYYYAVRREKRKCW